MEINCSHTEIVPISSLKPNPKNPNKHNDQQIKLLAKIMLHQGWRAPIVVSKNSGYIIKGHGRLEAARLNKWSEIPVDMQAYASDQDEYADMVADNEIARLAKTDLSQVLSDVLDFGPDFDFDLLGIPDFRLPEDFEAQCDEDAIPEHVEPKSKLGDIYQLGRHRLMCGDSVNIQHIDTLLEGKKADMVFTDPPYNVAYGSSKNPIWGSKWNGNSPEGVIKNDSMSTEEWIKFCKDIAGSLVAATAGPIYACHAPGPDGMRMTLAFIESGLHWSSTIILHKSQLVPGRADYQKKYEGCFYGWVEGTKIQHLEDRTQTDVWDYKRPSVNTVHPTMKPIEIMEKAISHHPGVRTIVDLFGGSGSTLIACEKTSRKCFMMELDPHYCDVIVARWEKYTGQKAELLDV